jgi:hypothetical protein
MATKAKTIRITVSDDLKAWIDAEAEDVGLDATSWVKMILVAKRKGRSVIPVSTPSEAIAPSLPALPGHLPLPLRPDPGYSLNLPLDDDSWRGPVDNSPPGADTAIGDAVRPTVNPACAACRHPAHACRRAVGVPGAAALHAGVTRRGSGRRRHRHRAVRSLCRWGVLLIDKVARRRRPC